MAEFFEFLKKFFCRFLKLAGVLDIWKSKYVQFLWGFPILMFSRRWVVMVGVLIIIVVGQFMPISSFEKTKVLVAGDYFNSNKHLTLAKVAAENNDFELARSEYVLAEKFLLSSGDKNVLGATDEFVNVGRMVYPKKTNKKEIDKLEKLLAEKPGHRNMLLKLAVLYWKQDNIAKAKKYFQNAKILDPNNDLVKDVGVLFSYNDDSL